MLILIGSAGFIGYSIYQNDQAPDDTGAYTPGQGNNCGATCDSNSDCTTGAGGDTVCNTSLGKCEARICSQGVPCDSINGAKCTPRYQNSAIWLSWNYPGYNNTPSAGAQSVKWAGSIIQNGTPNCVLAGGANAGQNPGPWVVRVYDSKAPTTAAEAGMSLAAQSYNWGPIPNIANVANPPAAGKSYVLCCIEVVSIDQGNMNATGNIAACSTLTTTDAVCGNSIVEAPEECDDGNTTNGDGCSSQCKTETNTNEPVCGDGVKEGSEICDDGNTTNGDGCSSTCQIEVTGDPGCGNGTVDPGEECDDGNTVSGDLCRANCTLPVCNDGRDNDGDGKIDCTPGAEDPGCFPDANGGGGTCQRSDESEEDGKKPQCSDGIDNDNDGKTDCTAGAEDPGCYPNGNGGGGACNPNDDSELNQLPQTASARDLTMYALAIAMMVAAGVAYSRGVGAETLAPVFAGISNGLYNLKEALIPNKIKSKYERTLTRK